MPKAVEPTARAVHLLETVSTSPHQRALEAKSVNILICLRRLKIAPSAFITKSERSFLGAENRDPRNLIQRLNAEASDADLKVIDPT